MAKDTIISNINVDNGADNGKVPVYNSTTKIFDMTTAGSSSFNPYGGTYILHNWDSTDWTEAGSGGAVNYRNISANFVSAGGGTSNYVVYVGSVNGNALTDFGLSGKEFTVQWVFNGIDTISANHTIYFRVESGGSETTSPPSSTVSHFGFTLSNGAIICSNANGTTQTTTTATSTFTSGQTTKLLRAVFTNGTNVKFYVNNTLEATHTTNLPTSTTWRPKIGFNNTDTTSRDFDVGVVSYYQAI